MYMRLRWLVWARVYQTLYLSISRLLPTLERTVHSTSPVHIPVQQLKTPNDTRTARGQCEQCECTNRPHVNTYIISLTLKENVHGTLMQLVRKHRQFEYQDSSGLRMVSINKNSVPPKNFKRFVPHKQEESDKHKGLASRSISRRLPRPPIHQHLPLMSTPETFWRM